MYFIYLFCVHLMGKLSTLWGVCAGQRKILSRLSFYLVVLGIEVRPLVWAAGIPAGSSAPTEPCHWPLSPKRVYGSRLSGNIVLSQGCSIKRVGVLRGG